MTRTEKKRCIALVIALIFILCGCSGSSGKKDEWYRVKQIYVVDGRVRSTRSWDLDEQNRKSVEYLDGAWNAEWTYDEDGNIATYEYMEYSYKVRVEYTYEDGLLTKEVRRADLSYGTKETEILYEYEDGRVVKETRNGREAKKYVYNDDGSYDVMQPYADIPEWYTLKYDADGRILADNTGFEYTYTLSDDGDLLEKQTYLNGTLVEELINVYNSDGELETSTRKNVNGTWETVYEYEEGCIVYSRTMGIDGDAASAAYQEIKEYYYSYVNDAGKTVGRDPE